MIDSDDFMDPELLAEAASAELLAALAGLVVLRQALRGGDRPGNLALFSPRPTVSHAPARKARRTGRGKADAGQGGRGSWPRRVE